MVVRALDYPVALARMSGREWRRGGREALKVLASAALADCVAAQRAARARASSHCVVGLGDGWILLRGHNPRYAVAPENHDMGTSKLQVRAFGTAGLSTISLFAIAAWIPNDAIAFVAWLIAVLLGIPVSVLRRVYFARGAFSTGQSVPSIFSTFDAASARYRYSWEPGLSGGRHTASSCGSCPSSGVYRPSRRPCWQRHSSASDAAC